MHGCACRDACSSVHSFVKRLFNADTLARLSEEDRGRWQAHVPAAAPLLLRRLLAGLLGFLPYSVADHIPDVIFAILKVRCSALPGAMLAPLCCCRLCIRGCTPAWARP